MQLFEYAIIAQEKRNKDGDVTEDAQILVSVTTVLALDEKQAMIFAAKDVPEGWMPKLDRVQIVLRPF